MLERPVISLAQIRSKSQKDRPNLVEMSKNFILPVGGKIAKRFSIFPESGSKDNFGTNRGNSLRVVYKNCSGIYPSHQSGVSAKDSIKICQQIQDFGVVISFPSMPK
jgi:hypothetical protein